MRAGAADGESPLTERRPTLGEILVDLADLVLRPDHPELRDRVERAVAGMAQDAETDDLQVVEEGLRGRGRDLRAKAPAFAALLGFLAGKPSHASAPSAEAPPDGEALLRSQVVRELLAACDAARPGWASGFDRSDPSLSTVEYWLAGFEADAVQESLVLAQTRRLVGEAAWADPTERCWLERWARHGTSPFDWWKAHWIIGRHLARPLRDKPAATVCLLLDDGGLPPPDAAGSQLLTLAKLAEEVAVTLRKPEPLARKMVLWQCAVAQRPVRVLFEGVRLTSWLRGQSLSFVADDATAPRRGTDAVIYWRDRWAEAGLGDSPGTSDKPSTSFDSVRAAFKDELVLWRAGESADPAKSALDIMGRARLASLDEDDRRRCAANVLAEFLNSRTSHPDALLPVLVECAATEAVLPPGLLAATVAASSALDRATGRHTVFALARLVEALLRRGLWQELRSDEQAPAAGRLLRQAFEKTLGRTDLAARAACVPAAAVLTHVQILDEAVGIFGKLTRLVELHKVKYQQPYYGRLFNDGVIRAMIEELIPELSQANDGFDVPCLLDYLYIVDARVVRAWFGMRGVGGFVRERDVLVLKLSKELNDTIVYNVGRTLACFALPHHSLSSPLGPPPEAPVSMEEFFASISN